MKYEMHFASNNESVYTLCASIMFLISHPFLSGIDVFVHLNLTLVAWLNVLFVVVS